MADPRGIEHRRVQVAGGPCVADLVEGKAPFGIVDDILRAGFSQGAEIDLAEIS